MRWLGPKQIAPVAVLAAGALLALLLVKTAPEVEAETAARPAPLVRAIPATPRSVQLEVTTHGTVAPRTESELVPEVSGPVIEVSPSFVSGGFFEAGEVLLRVDPQDYEVALERARANLVRRESEHERDQRELERQQKLAEREFASPQRLDTARTQARVAAASLREARASLDQAERDLARTRLRTPFRGRVRETSVDVGEFVNRGAPVATLYAIDYAEIRLPLADDDLAHLDLPLAQPSGAVDTAGPEVELRARFAGRDHTWQGRVVRTEGEIDPRSRMVHVIARVEDPYAVERDRPPLAVGLFVEAAIAGRRVDDALVLPREALRAGDRLFVVDAEERLHIRPAELVRAQADEVVVRAELAAGDRVVVSPLDAAVEGMRVRVAESPPARAAEDRS